ncbi:Lactose permease [Grifola frondosa]|uniref:Lactose permease n=1 Tax=Grifola frondosa TaxID=5627 RepID=A0A1C7LK22_GRIFR|nr:Lactose permease [Grifola frondosa]
MPLLITELAYPTQRGKLTSMYNASCLHMNGKVSAAWTCFGAYKGAATSQWSWRVPTLIQALALVVQIVLIWFIPESPRFLVAKGRESKAASILARYHTTDGDERDPLVMFETPQIWHAHSAFSPSVSASYMPEELMMATPFDSPTAWRDALILQHKGPASNESAGSTDGHSMLDNATEVMAGCKDDMWELWGDPVIRDMLVLVLLIEFLFSVCKSE